MNDQGEQPTPPNPPLDLPTVPVPPPLAIDYGRVPPRQPPSRTGAAVAARIFTGFVVYVVFSVVWFHVAPIYAGSSFVLWIYATLAILGFTLWLRVARGYKGYGYGVITALLSALIIGIALVIFIITKCSK
jgi:hypothetical protein